MPEFMRAIDVRGGTGPASALFINNQTPKPVPGPGECLVRVRAFGINRADTLQRQGLYPGISHLTKTLGLEFSGVISTIRDHEGDQGQQDGLHPWQVGDEVFGLVYGGGYAEYVLVNTQMLIAKPESLSLEECGGLCETWFTALQALHLVGQATPATTRSILWHAGSSAVSIAGIQLSQVKELFGKDTPRVFATTRQQEKCDFCVDKLGCAGAVNLKDNHGHTWADEIKRLNDGQGVDLIIDFLGGPYLESNINLLALDGSIVQLGILEGPVVPANANFVGLLLKRARIQGSTLRSRNIEYQIRLRQMFEQFALPGLVDGRLKNVVDTILPWQKVGEAHGLLERNETKGKVICTID